MKKLLTFLIGIALVCSACAQSTFTQNVRVLKASPKVSLQGTGGIIDFLNGSAHITLTQSVNTLTLAGGDFAMGANNLLGTGTIGTTSARFSKAWLTNLEITNTPTIGGVPLSSLYATSASVSAITATSLGLGNVTNLSMSTMFTEPRFTGSYIMIGTDTIATRPYSRSYGGGGGGAGTWGSITGDITIQFDLQTALSLKLATNGSAASLTNFPTLNQSTTGSAAKWTTSRSLWGNNVDGSGNITSIIASTYGGTGNGFTKFSGATITEKTYTLPNASATILTDNAAVTVAQGGTGRATSTTAYGLIAAGTTATGAQQTLATGSAGQILRSGGSGALPVFSIATYPTVSGTARKVLISDGTNFVSSIETYAAPSTSGNVMQSDGTNWTSATPVELSTLEITPSDTSSMLAPYSRKHPTTRALTSSGTFTVADDGNYVTMTSSGSPTMTIPLHSSVAIPAGASITVINKGTGTLTLVVTGGVTADYPALGIPQHGWAFLYWEATDVVDITGKLQ
jgi:hypothetical protein